MSTTATIPAMMMMTTTTSKAVSMAQYTGITAATAASNGTPTLMAVWNDTEVSMEEQTSTIAI